MVDRSNSERLRGFGDKLTDGQTFAIVDSLSRLKIFITVNASVSSILFFFQRCK